MNLLKLGRFTSSPYICHTKAVTALVQYSTRCLYHRHSQGGCAPKTFLAYLVILCFEKWHPKQKFCCLPKDKHFAHPPKF